MLQWCLGARKPQNGLQGSIATENEAKMGWRFLHAAMHCLHPTTLQSNPPSNGRGVGSDAQQYTPTTQMTHKEARTRLPRSRE